MIVLIIIIALALLNLAMMGYKAATSFKAHRKAKKALEDYKSTRRRESSI